jgi:glycosyltransferase involved in cell wall biosynthesis
MRIGLIARADSRGLGVQTKSFHDNMRPTKTLVIDCSSAKPLPIRRDWYPDARWIHGLPKSEDCLRFLHGLDAVYTAETFYGRKEQPSPMCQHAQQMGVKTVLHLNYEFLNRHEKPALWAAPSKWHWGDIPNPKLFLPVPVETHRFNPQPADKATNFLCVIGRPAEVRINGVTHERAGAKDLLLALQSVRSQIAVTVTCQEPGHVKHLLRANNIQIPPNVTLNVADGDVTNNWDLYTGQHVLISPRRFGGLSLPHQEACAAGMPVIAPAISPNTDWLPPEWLVPAVRVGRFTAHTQCDLYKTDTEALAAKIDQFASDASFYRNAAEQAVTTAKQLSWEQLRPEYVRALT